MTASDDAKQRAIAAARTASERRKGRASPTGGDPQAWPQAPRFEDLADYRGIERLRTASAAMGVANPYFRLHEGHAGVRTVIDGREALNFASYDYAGLNADPRTSAAAKAAIDRHGVSPSGSRLVSGARPVHLALEAALARNYGTAAAICFVSGHSTNTSTISCLMGEGDLIVQDALVHNSLQVGAKLSGAARRSFAHNDMAALEALLIENRARYRNALIVVEGHYSMDGDTPPLPQLIALKRKYGCWLMVDEAHALGCVGATGKGVFEHYGVDPAQVDIWMGTLSKTLASTGGYIAGSTALIDLLMGNASGYVYSVALAPALAASALEALELLRAEPWRARKITAKCRVLHRNRAGGGARHWRGRTVFDRADHGGEFGAGGQTFRATSCARHQCAASDLSGRADAGRTSAVFLTALHEPEHIRTAVEATCEELHTSARRAVWFGLLANFAGPAMARQPIGLRQDAAHEVSVVGAGFSGAVIARETGRGGPRGDRIDERPTVGGNCRTERDAADRCDAPCARTALFHTDDERGLELRQPLCRDDAVPAPGDGACGRAGFSLPLNLRPSASFSATALQPRRRPRLLPDVPLHRTDRRCAELRARRRCRGMGEALYRAFFEGYTRKQWGVVAARTRPPSMLSRLPLRFTHDSDYFGHRFQAIPRAG